VKAYRLYTVETAKERHITTVAARSNQEATRKAWKAIFKHRPDIVPILQRKGIIVMLKNEGALWGEANFNG